MTPALHPADQDLLQKLLLGQLPSAEAERLAAQCTDDSRLAALADSLSGQDTLLNLLKHQETAVDSDAERLVARLVQRLQTVLPVALAHETAGSNPTDATLPPSVFAAGPGTQTLPEQLEYYKPLKVLGQGGMGTVYLALDTRLGREVAIKTLRPELAANPHAKERFLPEARTAAKLGHDHIISHLLRGGGGWHAVSSRHAAAQGRAAGCLPQANGPATRGGSRSHRSRDGLCTGSGT